MERLREAVAPGAAGPMDRVPAGALGEYQSQPQYEYKKGEGYQAPGLPIAGMRDTGGRGVLNATQLVSLMKEQGASEQEAATMAAIAMAESRGKPGALNPRGRDLSYGLWQINMIGNLGPERMKKYGLNSYEDLYDPKTNARVAYALMKEEGFRPWTTYTGGAYRSYLGTTSSVAAAAPSTYTPETAAAVPAGGVSRVQQLQAEVAGVRKGELQPKLVQQLEYAATQTGVQVEQPVQQDMIWGALLT
jgi:hypothetical protein